MTSSNLHDLLDEATLDIPASVAQPPLSAIRGRVKRRRAGFAATGAAAAVALVLAVAIPFHRDKAPYTPGPPAATPSPIAWEFGFADGANLTVWTKLHKCTFLDNPTAVATHTGESYIISLVGNLDTTSGCSSPDSNGVVSRTELVQATVRLDGTVPVHLIRDAASGEIRPIYSRSDLPIGFAEGAGRVVSWGAESRNGAGAEFRGSFQTQKSVSPPLEIIAVNFRGLGLSATPPKIADGEEASFGSISGWLAPGENGKSYRFVWYEPRGSAWITYELFTNRGLPAKAEFVSLLQKLTWP